MKEHIARCAICDRYINAHWWVCKMCAKTYGLYGLKYKDWPDWAKALQLSEQQRRTQVYHEKVGNIELHTDVGKWADNGDNWLPGGKYRSGPKYGYYDDAGYWHSNGADEESSRGTPTFFGPPSLLDLLAEGWLLPTPYPEGIETKIYDSKSGELERIERISPKKAQQIYYNANRLPSQVSQWRGRTDRRKNAVEHTTIDDVEGKPCSKCGVWKPISEFRKSPDTSDKLDSQCKDCCKEYYESAAGQAAAQRGRAKREALQGNIAGKEIVTLIRQTHCAYCGALLPHSPDTWLDHIIPISKGGLHEAWNVVYTCRACNASKYDKWPSDWMPDIYDKLRALQESGDEAYSLLDIDRIEEFERTHQ